jgi:hypothetical protein
MRWPEDAYLVVLGVLSLAPAALHMRRTASLQLMLGTQRDTLLSWLPDQGARSAF